MVEVARFPRTRRMTRAAIVVEIILRVIRISRSRKISAVAIKAQARRVYISAGMAGNTGQ